MTARKQKPDGTRRPKGLSTSPHEVALRKERFIRAYATTGVAEAACVAAGYTESGSRSMAPQLMADPVIGNRAREAREAFVRKTEDAHDRQAKALIEASDDAIKTLQSIAAGAPRTEDGKPDRSWAIGAQARVQAAVAILDRAGHKPVERIEQTVSWEQAVQEIMDVDFVEVLKDALEDHALPQIGHDAEHDSSTIAEVCNQQTGNA